MKRNNIGYTLTELMIVVAILGVIFGVAPKLLIQIRRFFIISSAHVELQRDGRDVMALMTRRIRQAQSSTLNITQISGQPYYSRIYFTDVEGNFVSYYQEGKDLKMIVQNSTKTIAKNLRYLTFAIPRSDDLGILSVGLTLEKDIYEGQKKALQMASEKVRLMN